MDVAGDLPALPGGNMFTDTVQVKVNNTVPPNEVRLAVLSENDTYLRYIRDSVGPGTFVEYITKGIVGKPEFVVKSSSQEKVKAAVDLITDLLEGVKEALDKLNLAHVPMKAKQHWADADDEDMDLLPSGPSFPSAMPERWPNDERNVTAAKPQRAGVDGTEPDGTDDWVPVAGSGHKAANRQGSGYGGGWSRDSGRGDREDGWQGQRRDGFHSKGKRDREAGNSMGKGRVNARGEDGEDGGRIVENSWRRSNEDGDTRRRDRDDGGKSRRKGEDGKGQESKGGKGKSRGKLGKSKGCWVADRPETGDRAENAEEEEEEGETKIRTFDRATMKTTASGLTFAQLLSGKTVVEATEDKPEVVEPVKETVEAATAWKQPDQDDYTAQAPPDSPDTSARLRLRPEPAGPAPGPPPMELPTPSEPPRTRRGWAVVDKDVPEASHHAAEAPAHQAPAAPEPPASQAAKIVEAHDQGDEDLVPATPKQEALPAHQPTRSSWDSEDEEDKAQSKQQAKAEETNEATTQKAAEKSEPVDEGWSSVVRKVLPVQETPQRVVGKGSSSGKGRKEDAKPDIRKPSEAALREADDQARIRAEKAQRERDRQLEIQRKWKEEQAASLARGAEGKKSRKAVAEVPASNGLKKVEQETNNSSLEGATTLENSVQDVQQKEDQPEQSQHERPEEEDQEEVKLQEPVEPEEQNEPVEPEEQNEPVEQNQEEQHEEQVPEEVPKVQEQPKTKTVTNHTAKKEVARAEAAAEDDDAEASKGKPSKRQKKNKAAAEKAATAEPVAEAPAAEDEAHAAADEAPSAIEAVVEDEDEAYAAHDEEAPNDNEEVEEKGKVKYSGPRKRNSTARPKAKAGSASSKKGKDKRKKKGKDDEAEPEVPADAIASQSVADEAALMKYWRFCRRWLPEFLRTAGDRRIFGQ